MQDECLTGKIYNEEWKNEGYNNTLLIQRTQEMLDEMQFPLEETYILLLDPTEAVQVDANFSKKQLKEDAYLLFEQRFSPLFSHYTPNLFRASLNWKCNGPLYGRWNIPPDSEKFYFFQIQKAEPFKEWEAPKLENELQILTEVSKSEPNNPYYLFYLAQTHRALGHYKEAIRQYQDYIQKKENEEKIWLSKYMIGDCYEQLGNWEKALHAYLETYQSNTDRAEPLWKIAFYYRKKGQSDLAYIFAKHGSRIPHSNDHLFFPLEPLQNYSFDEELSISSFYTRFKGEGFLAADALILNKSAPHYLKLNTFQNLLFYVKNLPNATFLPIDVKLPQIVDDLPDLYNPMNPSIQKTPTGYKVICRSVNYTQEGAKSFHTVDYDGIFRTRNFLLEYSPDFQVLSQQEILEDLPRERIRTFSIEGLDDCRIFEYNDSSWFACTTGDTNPCGNFQISLCKLEDRSPYEDIYVEKLLPLQGPDPYRCEKNWLPFVHRDQLHLVYSCSPFTIYQPDLETGECTTVLSYEPEYDFSSFRGSAAPIPFDDGYLMLVHEVTLFQNQGRCYFHRFLYLDQNFRVKKLSLPFTFKHQGIEYCCGMTLDHSNTQLILPIGIEDREAHLCFVDLNTVRSLLRPLETFSELNFCRF